MSSNDITSRKVIATITPQEASDPNFISAHAKDMKSDVLIKLDDGSTVQLPVVMAIFQGLLWPAYTTFNIPITKNEIFWPDRKVDKDTGKAIYSFTSDTVKRCSDKIYNELILKYRIPNYMDGVAQIWLIINRFAMFADRHTREYQTSLDLLSLAKLYVQKPMKDICERTIDCTHGTKYAEKQFEQGGKELMAVLGKPGLLKDNVLMPFMLTKLLKRNQVPQCFFAYGTRSDIDDSMMKHAISASAFKGLNGVEDYAIESLSAKKAEYFNSAVIQDAQYFARRCRLASSTAPKLYKGSCGSDVTLTVEIPEKYKQHYIGKFVKVDDETRDLLAQREWQPQHGEDYSVELTEKNINRFIGRPVQMWSPFGCRHTDGVCEHCAGYMHQRLEAYCPEDIHLGVFYATKVVSAVTQMILSAKHLIKTSSKEFNFAPQAAKYFLKAGDAIVWQPGTVKGIRNCSVRLESGALIGSLNDLTRQTLPSGVSFSRVDKVGLLNSKGETIDVIQIGDGTTTPFFSGYMMQYMREHYKSIVQDGDYIDIPMKDFDFTKAFLRYTAVNDDMVSYVKRVEKFLMSRIREYTSISQALKDFSELVYTKAGVSIFAIEIMLRCYLRDEKFEGIPVLTDTNAPVRFAGMNDVISSASLTTKLAFQGLIEMFKDPQPTLHKIGNGYGYYDSLFNCAKVV